MKNKKIINKNSLIIFYTKLIKDNFKPFIIPKFVIFLISVNFFINSPLLNSISSIKGNFSFISQKHFAFYCIINSCFLFFKEMKEFYYTKDNIFH